MLDKDGIERPDTPDGHVLERKNQKRKVQFDGKYNYRPRNIFFRMWAAFFRALAIAVFNPFVRIKYGYKTYGGEHIRGLKGKPYIVTVNHVHMFDDMSIGTNIYAWRKIYFTTLDQNIRRPMIGFFLRSLGGIPIPVESVAGMKKFNEDISYLLKKGKVVLYNPEGALWPYYREIRPFKRGAFSMAVKNDVPVLPLVMTFKRKKKRNGKYKYKIFYTACEPVYADKTLATEHEQSKKMQEIVYNKTVETAKNFYESQDCGFGDEKNK